MDCVPGSNQGTFSTYDDFCDRVGELFKEVAEMRISEAEEGAVLYFVMNLGNQESERMLSMCKLKTLEYRVFRKLREKLRNFVEASHSGKGNANAESKMDQFIKETNELCNGYKLPHNLEIYQRIAQLAFNCLFGKRGQEYEKLLKDRYIDFLSEVMREKGSQFSDEYIAEFFGSTAFDEV